MPDFQSFAHLTCAPTKEQHDAVVARKGRPYTDDGVRAVRQPDSDATDSGLSLVDRVLADARRSEP